MKMKLTKRILSLLLAATLTIGIAAPTAFALDEQDSGINWDEFYITKQPSGMIVPYGETFTLSIEVHAPEGAEVEYQWFAVTSEGTFSSINHSSAKPETRISWGTHYPLIEMSNNPYAAQYRDYYCMVTAGEKSNEGEFVPARQLKSDTIRVISAFNSTQKIRNITVEPLQAGAIGAMATLVFTAGLGLPFVPVSFVGIYVYGLVTGVMGLFVNVGKKDLVVDNPA